MVRFVFVQLREFQTYMRKIKSRTMMWDTSSSSYAQFGFHEVGIISGQLRFRSDYGWQWYNLTTNAGRPLVQELVSIHLNFSSICIYGVHNWSKL
jgi:hypothetical protein